MSSMKKLHIPNVITEFDENMLIPLSRNFGEIQRHVARAEANLEAMDLGFATALQEINQILIEMDGQIDELYGAVNWLLEEHGQEPIGEG